MEILSLRKKKGKEVEQRVPKLSTTVTLITSQSDCSALDETSPLSLPSLYPPPIVRQFWKAGNYEIGQGSKAPIQSHGRIVVPMFDDIGQHGTKIVIYNLWLNDDGYIELDFNIDPEDIHISAGPKFIQKGHHPKPVLDQHIANLYCYSLRVYISILYLRIPQNFKIILRGQVVECHNIVNDLKFPEFVLYRPQIGGSMEPSLYVEIHGFNIYQRNRLILPFWRAVNKTNNYGRGVVGVLEANFIEPTHNKQDFEKTSLFQKLEARLKDMTMDYWKFHCGLIGYQQVKNSSPVSVPSQKPLPSRARSCVEQPVLLNHRSLVIDNPRPVSLEVESFKDNAATPSHVSSRSLRQFIDSHDLGSQHGLNMKRKEQASAMELEHAKRPTGSGSYGTDTPHMRHIGVKQLASGSELQLHDEKIITLMQENKKLHLWFMELERMEKELKLKVQQLRSELGDTQLEYARLLIESNSMSTTKVEKNVDQ